MITYSRVTSTKSIASPGNHVNGALGDRVRSLREAMDLSLRDLADRSGVSAPMLSQVERGETSPTLAVAENARLDVVLWATTAGDSPSRVDPGIRPVRGVLSRIS